MPIPLSKITITTTTLNPEKAFVLLVCTIELDSTSQTANDTRLTICLSLERGGELVPLQKACLEELRTNILSNQLICLWQLKLTADEKCMGTIILLEGTQLLKKHSFILNELTQENEG